METQKDIRLRRIKAHQDVEEISFLPQEIIERILLGLPTKSILRFKCVSKPWRSLISSDSFVKAHLEKSLKDQSFERHHITFKNSRGHAEQCLLASFMYEPDRATYVDINYPTCVSSDSAFIIGSCNGLVCVLKNDMHFILWNPSTGKFKELSPMFDDMERNYLSLDGSHFYADAYGFGFDECNDDYKVFIVFVIWINLPNGVELKRSIKVYSLKMDSWRRVEGHMVDQEFNPVGRFVSGKLYWEVIPSGATEWCIVSFDLENETFGSVEWPSGTKDCYLSYAIDGCLCCFSPTSDNSKPNHLDCWRMIKDSWYKYATLGCPRLVADEIVVDEDDECFFPVIVCPNGDIVASYSHFFIIFIKDQGAFLSPKVLESQAFNRTSIYVESLVEP